MKLILTRHGETIENKKRIWMGHLPGKLSKKGIEQVEKLSLRFKDEKIDAIYSSDLARASDTAKEIAKFHLKIPINFVKELRERDFKEYAGKPKSIDKKEEKIESREGMCKRAKELLDEVYKKYPNSTVLFVGHNGINNALICVIMNKPADYMKEFGTQKNTAVSIFEINKGENHMRLLNCTKHLD